jgi:hypothetical protein
MTFFLPTRSARKPPAKFAATIAMLLTEIEMAKNAAVASSVLTKSLIRKNTGDAVTILLAKVAMKMMTNNKTKFREA